MKQSISKFSTLPALDIETTAGLYKRFISYVDASPATVRTYSAEIRQFIAYLDQHQRRNVTRETILLYRDYLKEHYKPTTVQNYIEAVKIFFCWTAQEGLYPDIAHHIKGAKIGKEHKKDYLTGKQVNDLLRSIDRSTEKGKRDYLLVLLAAVGGLRVIELHRADIKDLSILGNTTVLYIQGKGREEKNEFIKLPDPVENALRDYLHIRGAVSKGSPLFVSASHNGKNRRLTVRSISGIIKKAMIDAGYNSERLTAHSLRHTAVTLSLLAGVPLEEVQQFARHRNISTTQIYAHNLERANNRSESAICNAIFAELEGSTTK